MHLRFRSGPALTLGLLLSACTTTMRAPAPVPAPAPASAPVASPAPSATVPLAGCAPCPRDAHEQLQLTLWMQTAAEYRMVARSLYATAIRTLDQALADPTWTAAVEQTADPSKLPPAVILDLDETVLDNSRFEGELALRRATFDPKLWTEWVKLERAELIPGARELIAAARGKGVTVFFVSNRDLAEEPSTIANLAALGIEASPEMILSQHENGWDSSDKTARRTVVAATHRILMLFGDDLGDFIPSRLAPAERVTAAERHLDWWGVRWFVLPNPSYGSWERALWNHEGGLSDRDQLLRKYARIKGFWN